MPEQSHTDTVMQRDPDVGIREGDTVIVDVNGEKQAFLTVRRTGCVHELGFLPANLGDQSSLKFAVHRLPLPCLRRLMLRMQQSEGWQAALLPGAYYWSAIWQCLSSGC